jgi:HEAT repeat protein
MSRTLVSLAAVLLCCATTFGQEQPLAQVTYAKGQEAKLIAVLNSDAPQKDKADACRLLAIVGTKNAVAPLAALLDDEKLAHMARYGLEPNPDPSVNVALRDALGKVKGLHLVGVIGSLGVRKDAAAVEPIGKLLCDKECVVKQAAARALGRIGTPEAAKAIDGALAGVDDCCKLAFCEGLLRAAEGLARSGNKDAAVAICDKLSKESVAPQVKLGAAKKARMLRQVPGKGL